MSMSDFRAHHPALAEVLAVATMFGVIFGGGLAAAEVSVLTGSAALVVGIAVVTAMGGGALLAKLTH